jgi:DNA-binding beta-propeller fold protein YncE
MNHWSHILLILAAALTAPAARAVDVSYLHGLSSTTGFIPFSGVSLSYDDRNRELLVYGGGVVRVFNEAGMEVFTFGDDPAAAGIVSVASFAGGDLLALSVSGGQPTLLRLDFRGERVGRIELTGLPPEYARFTPARLAHHGGKIYLADLGGMYFVIADDKGRFEKIFDVAQLLHVEDKRQDTGIRGFGLDKAGNILFTVQPLFTVGILSLDGTLRTFGVPGGAPGRFNIVSGVAADEQGNIYVSDVLKSAVLVFDKDLRFVREFGFRGNRPGSLFAPVDLAFGHGKLYVSQYARRGVSVFRITDPAAPPS